MGLIAQAKQFLDSHVGRTNIPFAFGHATQITRSEEDAIYKAVIPHFLIETPFGHPRFVDIPSLRRLSKSPFVSMAIGTILDEMAAVPWEITGKGDNANQSHIKEVDEFFDNPNKNDESFDLLLRTVGRDVLEIDSGLWVKVFDRTGKMVELYSRDGGTFTKNPDRHGIIGNRAELIPDIFSTHFTESSQDHQSDIAEIMKQRAAYFQFPWVTGGFPIPFGWREIVFMMRHPRTDSIYGRSSVEILADVIQMLIFGVDHNLEYFTDNEIPKGVFEMINASKQDIDAFRAGWRKRLKVKDQVGNIRNAWHHMPIVNTKGEFQRFSFTNVELELLEQQRWFSKIVWACFGVTPSELGFTESSNRATELTQSRVFKRKALRPLLTLIEYHINTQIIPEFGHDDVQFKFVQEDIDEDILKHGVYKVQLITGLRTINEIRAIEELPPVAWGDEPFRPLGNISGGGFGGPPESGFGPPRSPTTGKSLEKKAFTTDSPLILGPFEVPHKPERLERTIDFLLNKQEKEILKILRESESNNTLDKIGAKAIPLDMLEKIKAALGIANAKLISDAVIRGAFLKGLDEVGEDLNRDFAPDKGAIDFLQQHTFSNIKDMNDEIENDLRQIVERGITEGKNPRDLIPDISKVFDKNDARAETIARTEVNRALNAGHQNAMDQANVPGKKEWVASIDDKTSAVCKRLDGQKIGVKDQFEDPEFSGMFPPAHPNCRSRIVFVEGE